MKLNAKQLREYQESSIKSQEKKQEIYIILDNVLDTYNIGAVFRLADAVNVKKVYLCGGTETPPNPRIKKASINTTEIVDWEYCESAVEAIKKAKGDYRLQTTDSGETETVDLQVVAIEQDRGSVPYNEYDYQLPLALVVGNESYGILPETLKDCDAVLELPMFGINISLNVMVSLAVVLYQALSNTSYSGTKELKIT